MVSSMETNSSPDPAAAREALAQAAADQRAVRDTPWPTWLYPVNAVLLGAYAAATLLDPWHLPAWLALAALMLAVNITVGRRMGTPWVLPTSRGFLTFLVLAAACMVGAIFTGPEHPTAVWALAAGACISYLVGCAFHHRSTRR